MAIIENVMNGDEIILQNEYTIGRGKNNLYSIQQEEVSRRHAIIYWENDSWFLTDYSSNGTTVNSVHLHHKTIKLKKNDAIQFSKEEKERWMMRNLDQPNSFFRAIFPKNGYIDFEQGIFLPSMNNPQYSLIQNKHQEWIIDDGKIQTLLINGNNYFIDDIEYEFVENKCLTQTRVNTDITKNAFFEVLISQDEENISSRIKINDFILDLGERVYNHLLLLLIREKQLDIETGLSKELSGWVQMDYICDSLNKELLKEDIDNYYINILIHRLRKHLISIKPYGYLFANMIERQKGKLRFVMNNFEIKKEGEFAC